MEELGSTEEKRQRWLQTARVRKLSGGHWEEAGTQCGSEDCEEDGWQGGELRKVLGWGWERQEETGTQPGLDCGWEKQAARMGRVLALWGWQGESTMRVRAPLPLSDPFYSPVHPRDIARHRTRSHMVTECPGAGRR